MQPSSGLAFDEKGWVLLASLDAADVAAVDSAFLSELLSREAGRYARSTDHFTEITALLRRSIHPLIIERT
jgi:hypothetical protein